MSWYMTYTRTLGRGFSLDDPDVLAFTTTMIAAVIYVVYNVQVLVHPEVYVTSTLYTYADIMFFVGACFYIFASMRDLNWFWFLPFAGQYGIASGKVEVETKVLPQFGTPEILMIDCCRKRRKKPVEEPKKEDIDDDDIIVSFH